jgi:hypothetical protein
LLLLETSSCGVAWVLFLRHQSKLNLGMRPNESNFHPCQNIHMSDSLLPFQCLEEDSRSFNTLLTTFLGKHLWRPFEMTTFQLESLHSPRSYPRFRILRLFLDDQTEAKAILSNHFGVDMPIWSIEDISGRISFVNIICLILRSWMQFWTEASV